MKIRPNPGFLRENINPSAFDQTEAQKRHLATIRSPDLRFLNPAIFLGKFKKIYKGLCV